MCVYFLGVSLIALYRVLDQIEILYNIAASWMFVNQSGAAEYPEFQRAEAMCVRAAGG